MQIVAGVDCHEDTLARLPNGGATAAALNLISHEDWCRQLRVCLEEMEPKRSPWERLEAFVAQARTLSAVYVAHGCPLAGLVRDYAK